MQSPTDSISITTRAASPRGGGSCPRSRALARARLTGPAFTLLVPPMYSSPRPAPFASRDALDERALAAARSIPRPSLLSEPLELKPARAAKAARALGLDTAGDLLEHLPHRHEDLRDARPIATLAIKGEEATVIGDVRRIDSRRTRRRGL